MYECLPDLPRYVRQRGDEWQGADRQNGPWRPIPAPQPGLPWKADGPAPATPTLADRLALAVCSVKDPGTGMCVTGYICNRCRRDSAAVAHEIARQLRERYGTSVRADWLDGVGCHPSTVLVDADGVLPVEQGITGNGSGASLPLLSNQPRVWEPLPGAE
jgi:hypothetical protein